MATDALVRVRFDPGILPVPTALSPRCPASALVADVVAIDHPMVFNRLGAQNVNWMMYALRHDVIDRKSGHPFNYTDAGEQLFKASLRRNASRGIALRPDLRPRPLVLRVAAGGYLRVRLTNLLEVRSMPPHSTRGNPFNSEPNPLGGDHPMDHAAKDPAGTPDEERLFHIDDQVASRSVGFHPQGLELVGGIGSDSSYVGVNGNSLVAPGQTRDYCFHAPDEGAFLVSNPGASFGGEGTAGDSGVGLFGTIAVQPRRARFYRAQVTEEELRLATRGAAPQGQPIVDYEAAYPDDCPNGVWCREGKAGMPILNMVMKQRIVHGDVNAIVMGTRKDGHFEPDTYPLESEKRRNPTLPNRLEPFREFVSVYHDENAATQAFPYFFEHPELGHTLHGVRDAFMINYGSGGVGAEIIANRLQAGPMQDCLDCAYEEFFLSSFAVGDAAMLVDKPVNLAIGRCQPEFVEAHDRRARGESYSERHYSGFLQHCDWKSRGEKAFAQQAYYPHDPANVHHSYIGDFVKFRNVHAGKEQHIFHLHNHQWLFNPNDDNSNYIDAQGIGPGSGYTYEIAFGGSGNRNKTVGDAIFHCHFYPHFAQGMWYMWRNHDVMETGTRLAASETPGGYHEKPYGLKDGRPAKGSRALPDGEIVAGTPIPAVVPLPGKPLPPMPEAVHVTRKATGLGSKAELLKPFSEQTRNPGYPFWVAGVTEHGKVPASMGHRPTTPPLDMDASAGGFDGGLPRHALAGFAEGGKADSHLTRLSAAKHMKAAKPIYFDEKGTPLEQVAMAFHATREHPTQRQDIAGNLTPAAFVVNGAPPTPGAPYNEPCIDDGGKRLMTGRGDGRFFGGASLQNMIDVSDSLPGGIEFGADKPRVYKGANLQLDVVFNKLGYHYPQQRILTLWEDVAPTLERKRPPEPLVLRMNTFDCAMYQHTNLVPKEFYADDYQITTPTDVIGQHIHLPKWDLTSADGSANGWNYEDGTFAPGAVRERVYAINNWNSQQVSAGGTPVPRPDGSTAPLVPEPHPYFGSLPGHQRADCRKVWLDLGGDLAKFEKSVGAHPGRCDWLGARTTLQRWFSDPIVNSLGVHRGLGITFTHDHLGPSTHQQLGLYATMLTEPPGSQWRHNETGEILATRADGGPTTWQAVITGKDGKPIDVDGDGRDDAHREFFLQFGDFQHAYRKGVYVGVDESGVPYPYAPSAKAQPHHYRDAVHPSVRKPASSIKDIVKYDSHCPGGPAANKLHGAAYAAVAKPRRPCPEAISADDVGMMVVNYRNEPVAARVHDPSSGTQATGFRGDLSYALQTRTDRAHPELNTTLGSTPYPELTHGILLGDPFTPIMRAYSGDLIRVKVQAGSHEHEHNGNINGLAWMQGGSGYGQAPHSGWRNAQNVGLSEQFTFAARIVDYATVNNETDRLYTIDTSQDGLWSGTWGVLRSNNRRDQAADNLQVLPSNPRPTLLSPGEGQVRFNDCPIGAPLRTYRVAAVLANRALRNELGVVIDRGGGSALLDSGGTLVYNPRNTALTIEVVDENGKPTGKRHTYGTGPLHDPTAILFVREEDLDDKGVIKPGRPVEPLVLRAAAGECVQVVLRNRLPRGRPNMPDLDGYTALSGIVSKSSGSEMTSFNNNHIRPSNHIGLHPQMVHYDVQAYDGSVVGVNKRSLVGPGGAYLYQWYAGGLETVASAETCPVDQEDLAGKYADLNYFPRNPTLRPLTELYDRAAFDNMLYTLLDPKYAAGGEPGREAVAIAKDLAPIAAAQGCFESVLSPEQDRALLLQDETALASRTGPRLPPVVSAQRLAASGVFDEAPLLDPRATYERAARIRSRQVCAANLRTPFRERLARLAPNHVEVADQLARSFMHELPQVDDDGDFGRAFAWRRDAYPLLTRQTTRLGKLGSACRFVAIEFGGSNLTPPDRIKQGQKGAIGALVIEPEHGNLRAGERTHWSEFFDDTALDRQNPGSMQQGVRATRATATVVYPVRDATGDAGRKSMRDLAIVHQKGLNFRYARGGPVANLAAEREDLAHSPLETAPEDAHDAGHMAINYGSEPMWFRFGLAPDAPFGNDGLGGPHHAWQAFSNKCCDNGGTAQTAQQSVGEPYVPVMTTTAGTETRMRVLMPTGVGRATIFNQHGHLWPRDPYLAERLDGNGLPVGGGPGSWGTPSKCIGDNPLQMALGGQESVTPLAHFDLVFASAGGRARVPGDYLWRDMGGFGISNGLWGILRVVKSDQPVSPLRSRCGL